MGVCLSCLRTQDDDEPLLNEQTPLLRDTPQLQQQEHQQADEPQAQDSAERDQTLNSIVTFTGQNLIHHLSVSQPDVRSVGKTANEYKRALAELKFQNTSPSASPKLHQQHSPKSLSSIDTTGTSELLPRLSSIPLSDDDVSWLKDLGAGAAKAVKEEPVVKAVGNLVLTFDS